MSRLDRVLQEFEFENTASTGHRDQQGMADEIIRLRDLCEKKDREHRFLLEAADLEGKKRAESEHQLGKLEERRCGAGHENVLPLRLWDCPTCHNETRAKLKQTDIDLGKAERRYEAAEEKIADAEKEIEAWRDFHRVDRKIVGGGLKALGEMLQAATEEARRFYSSDGSFELLPTVDEAKRRRLKAAAALEVIGHEECSGPGEGMPICREGIGGMAQLPKHLWCFRCLARDALGIKIEASPSPESGEGDCGCDLWKVGGLKKIHPGCVIHADGRHMVAPSPSPEAGECDEGHERCDRLEHYWRGSQPPASEEGPEVSDGS